MPRAGQALRFAWSLAKAASLANRIWGLGIPGLVSAIVGILADRLGADEWLVIIVVVSGFLLALAILLALAERRWRLQFRTIYRSAGSDTAEQFLFVMRHISDAMHSKTEPYALAGRLLERSLLRELEQAKNVLGKRVETRWLPRFDTREAFIAFVRCYQGQVLWLRDAGYVASYNFAADGNYEAWKRADAAFLSEVKNLIDNTSDEGLRKAIRAESWAQGGKRDYW